MQQYVPPGMGVVQGLHWRSDARVNPERYSPVVRIQEFTSALVGRKIEIRLMMTPKKVVGVDQTPFLHCFEGTIAELHGETEKKVKKLSLTTEHAVARVRWDSEFDQEDTDHRLPRRKCMSETVHEGWNLLNPSYVEYADSIKEQEEQEKRRELHASGLVYLSHAEAGM